MKVNIRDLRAARMCSSGARDFFKRHQLDWSAFIKEGVEEEDLLNTGDAMAKRLVEVARGRQE